MPDKVEPRFNPDSIRENVRAPMSDSDNHRDKSIEKPKGSGILLNLVLLILVIALGGMGWLLLEQKQLIDDTQQQLKRLELIIQNRSEDDTAIEVSMTDQLGQLQREKEQSQQALNQELKQLREMITAETNARQNAQQTLQQTLTAQGARIQLMQDKPQPSDLTSNIEALAASVKQHAQTLTQLTETLTEQRNQLQSVERQLTNRLERLQTDVINASAPSTTPNANVSDVAVIELGLAELREDIRAINNARQLINRDLLQLREQLNRVQLMLN